MKRTKELLEQLAGVGVHEICLCPGKRNAYIVGALSQEHPFKVWNWPEERSAAFFALGRVRETGRPVAVVTTSGTAAGELFPAAMEAYYTSDPLLLITADRPRRFRGSGAPQSAEQQHLYGVYTPFSIDVEEEAFNLGKWDQCAPAHINICYEEPGAIKNVGLISAPKPARQRNLPSAHQEVQTFLDITEKPLVIVSSLKKEQRESVEKFIAAMSAPTYVEATSGLKRRLHAPCNEYDGILRIGGVPTHRLWRDLEGFQGPVLSITETPFSGISDKKAVHSCISTTFSHDYNFKKYVQYQDERPSLNDEAKWFETLSEIIPSGSQIYVGNSLPIRYWDLAASKTHHIYASRGLNGIDGQLSTFFGHVRSDCENWCILGDLTTLYDMVAPWIIPQLPKAPLRLVVINNGGGKIFSKFYSQPLFQHPHSLNFEGLARQWGLSYQRWENKPRELTQDNHLIEIRVF